MLTLTWELRESNRQIDSLLALFCVAPTSFCSESRSNSSTWPRTSVKLLIGVSIRLSPSLVGCIDACNLQSATGCGFCSAGRLIVCKSKSQTITASASSTESELLTAVPTAKTIKYLESSEDQRV